MDRLEGPTLSEDSEQRKELRKVKDDALLYCDYKRKTTKKLFFALIIRFPYIFHDIGNITIQYVA